MAGPSWLVDGNRFASKIKSASNPEKVIWKSNPTKACPNCQHTIDNDDVTHYWPGLPKGVKFDPTDEEILCHLIAKVSAGDSKPHPFIDEFISTVENDDGICYTHPQNLPGVRQDGSVSHFFHRAIKAYNTGTRKRRKIQGDDLGDVRWHKTGRTKPVILDGVQRGCKKIMVLYMNSAKGGKAEKTNWVMHQYHLGTGEVEREGEYVVSKIFYKVEDDTAENSDTVIAKVDPVTPKSVTPDPPRRCSDVDVEKECTTVDISSDVCTQHPVVECEEKDLGTECEKTKDDDQFNFKMENHSAQIDNENDNNAEEFPKWWDSGSQNLLDSQQLAEGLILCDEFLRSQSPYRDSEENERTNSKPCLSDYAQLGPEDLKKDLEECQNLVLDPAQIETDTPPDFRLSQLEFGSQDSFLAWGGGK